MTMERTQLIQLVLGMEATGRILIDMYILTASLPTHIVIFIKHGTVHSGSINPNTPIIIVPTVNTLDPLSSIGMGIHG